jgi:hypothetical protein
MMDLSLTEQERAINSEAIGAAAAMRDGGDVNPARLHALAKADAEELLAKWRAARR